MTFDPTTNRIEFELLTEEEKQALMAWPHGWERHSAGGWHDLGTPGWSRYFVYRGKPAPAVRSVWHNVFPDRLSLSMFESREMADKFAAGRIAVLRIDIINGKREYNEEPL